MSPYSSHIPFVIITLLVNCIKEFLISRRLKAGIRGKRRNYRVHEILFLRRPQGGKRTPGLRSAGSSQTDFSSASPKRLRRLKIFEARYSYFLTSKNIPSQNPRISRTKKTWLQRLARRRKKAPSPKKNPALLHRAYLLLFYPRLICAHRFQKVAHGVAAELLDDGSGDDQRRHRLSDHRRRRHRADVAALL